MAGGCDWKNETTVMQPFGLAISTLKMAQVIAIYIYIHTCTNQTVL